MTIETQNPRPGTSREGAGKGTRKQMTQMDHSTKAGRVLRALADGRRLDRFTAERELHDHVLPSTVASLQARFGLMIHRRIISVPGYQGHATRVAEYHLDADGRRRAREILEVRP